MEEARAEAEARIAALEAEKKAQQAAAIAQQQIAQVHRQAASGRTKYYELHHDDQSSVGLVPHVKSVKVELVFDPPWSSEMMSEEAQLEAGVFF